MWQSFDELVSFILDIWSQSWNCNSLQSYNRQLSRLVRQTERQTDS